MKIQPWTLGLLSAGLVTLPALMQAEEKPSSVMTALSSTTLSGYVDTSAQWNLGSGNNGVPNYGFGGTAKADGFNLNVVELNLEKPVDSADAWGAGYKVSLLAGPDASTFNTLSSSSLAGGSADFAVKQAYVALHAPVGNGLDFKIGVWDTPIGYEVFESINNPNVTRSYGYSIEPTTHTGVQANYQFCEAFSAMVGVADTFGPNINTRANPPKAESYKTYMAAMTFTAPTNMGFLAGSTLTGCVINGFNGGLGADETSWYIGGTLMTPVTGLKFGACYDYLGVAKQPLSGAGYANAVGLYCSYQLTEKLSIYGRGEYASTDLVPFGTAGVNPKEVFELTTTLQYDLWKNVLSRIEFRWDHASDASGPYGGNLPGGLPTKDNSYILLADIAYKF